MSEHRTGLNPAWFQHLKSSTFPSYYQASWQTISSYLTDLGMWGNLNSWVVSLFWHRRLAYCFFFCLFQALYKTSHNILKTIFHWALILISSRNSWRRVEWDHLHCQRITVNRKYRFFKILYMSQINLGTISEMKPLHGSEKYCAVARLLVSTLQQHESNIKIWVQSSQYNFRNKQIQSLVKLYWIQWFAGRNEWLVCVQKDSHHC